MPTTGRKILLGELLIQRGLITQDALQKALALQHDDPRYLGQLLVHLGLVNEDALLPTLADQVGIPYVRLRDLEIDKQAIAKVPPKFASQYVLVPIKFDQGVLHVAVSDPFNVQTLDELRLLMGCEVKPFLASEREILETIQKYYGLGASAVERLLQTNGHTAAAPTAGHKAEDLSPQIDEASVTSFVNQVILQAVRDRSTDIHIEPFETTMRIRERIDGILYEMSVPPDVLRLHSAVVSRIKVMAKLDIAEKRLPQDGRMKVRVPADPSGSTEQELDLRVSILPTSYGEGVDIRILSSNMLFSLAQLGLEHDNLQVLSEVIERPHGIIFVTGPTGSGKTTTLYSCLSKLNATDRKIITIEDPIEYQLQGITQIQVHPKIGLSFAQGLRSMLRHDPDIMMVGEVRDPETAEITIRSALTGHLVFSTLHTNDAAGGVTRLLDMEIEPFLIASSVLMFIAQRLVRVVCPACAKPIPTPLQLKEQFDVAELPSTIMQGAGCEGCKGSGYKGRTAIYEFLVVTEQVQQMILKRASSHEIARAAQAAGMRTLRQDGWLKIVKGVTTPQEVLRVA